jgi:ABC-type transport system involved in multi-copper enzyme maturation permease subunit
VTLLHFLLDPLAVKELSGTSRRWQTFATRVLYVALIGFVVWEFTRMWEQRARLLTVSDFARLGRDLFQAFFSLQMVMVTFGAVSASSDMVTKETRAGTLGVLSITPLTPFRIALGKWKAALAQTGTLILCGAPILAICVFLGGATAWDLTYSLALTLAAAALGAALSLYLSTRFRSGVTATLLALALLAAYTFVPGLLFPRRGSPDGAFLSYVHPVYAALMAANPRGRLSGYEFSWVSACAVTGFVTWLLLRLAAFRISELAIRTPQPPLLTRTFQAMDRFYEELGPERLRNIRIFDGGDSVWQTRALLWKELRTRASGKIRNSVRLSLALLILSVGAFWLSLEIFQVLIWVSSVAFLFLGLSNGVGLFVTEKEERKWDVLLSTPLSSWEIVQAKLLAGLVPLVPTTILLLLFWISLGWLRGLSFGDVAQGLLTVVLPGLVAYATGAAASLHARSLRAAFTVAFGAMVGLLAILPFLLYLAVPSLMGREDARFLLSALSPLPFLNEVAEAVRQYGGYGFRSELQPEAIFLFVVMYGGISGSLVAHMAARFNRITGRVAP